MSIANTAHSVVEPSPTTRRLAGSLVVLYAVITMIPLVWIVLTSFKSPDDAISYPPKIVFTPSLEGYLQSLHHALAPDAGIHPHAWDRRRGFATTLRAVAIWSSPDRRITCRVSSIR